MAGTIKIEVVTPEAKAFESDVDMVTLTGTEGEMGILPGHMPLMTQLVAGEIILKRGAENLHFAVGEGFVQVTGEKVSILTDMAIAADGIDEAKAQEALQRAQARLSQKLSDEESASVQAAIVHASTLLKVKRANRK
jgi:F-type H+-transporting ATPase subunit epsilon